MCIYHEAVHLPHDRPPLKWQVIYSFRGVLSLLKVMQCPGNNKFILEYIKIFYALWKLISSCFSSHSYPDHFSLDTEAWFLLATTESIFKMNSVFLCKKMVNLYFYKWYKVTLEKKRLTVGSEKKVPFCHTKAPISMVYITEC